MSTERAICRPLALRHRLILLRAGWWWPIAHMIEGWRWL